MQDNIKTTTDQEDKHLYFIENQNNCALCGTSLNIEIKNYLENYQIVEEAHCPACKITTRRKEHKIQ